MQYRCVVNFGTLSMLVFRAKLSLLYFLESLHFSTNSHPPQSNANKMIILLIFRIQNPFFLSEALMFVLGPKLLYECVCHSANYSFTHKRFYFLPIISSKISDIKLSLFAKNVFMLNMFTFQFVTHSVKQSQV